MKKSGSTVLLDALCFIFYFGSVGFFIAWISFRNFDLDLATFFFIMCFVFLITAIVLTFFDYFSFQKDKKAYDKQKETNENIKTEKLDENSKLFSRVNNNVVQTKDVSNITSNTFSLINTYDKSNLLKIAKDFFAIDLITTGNDLSKDRVKEISVIRFKNHVPVDKLNLYIDNSDTQPNFIKNKQLNYLSEIQAFSKLMIYMIEAEKLNVPVVGHNIRKYDILFIQNAFKRLKLNFSFNYADTLIIARDVLSLNSYTLTSLCNYFKIENNDVNSTFSNCLACGKVFLKLVELSK